MPTLTYVKVAGIPVAYDETTGILQVAGDKMTVDEWRELEHRINTLVTGKVALRNKQSHGALPNISPFIVANLPFINKLKHGLMKLPPFWLRPFYSAVITKEQLHDIN